jgi:Domain of unknown function (DUF4386)
MGRPAAIAAFASAIFLVGGTIVRQAIALSRRPDNESEFLQAVHDESASFLVSGILQSLNFLALGVVLWYLFRVIRYRRETLFGWVLYLVYLGPALLALAGVIADVDRIAIADDFTASGERTENRAENLLEDRSVVGVALGAAGTLGLAFALVLINMNGLRAGVLSRFIGIIGIIVGVLYVLPLFGGPLVVQIFWLGALAAVFLGRWPGGRGPAWESGEEEPWPTAAARRGLLTPGRAESEPDERPAEPRPEESAEPEPEEPAAEHPVSTRRKRKRRR